MCGVIDCADPEGECSGQQICGGAGSCFSFCP
jgi:hypothetical protein